MARRKKETVLKKVLKHERKTSPKANIPGPPEYREVDTLLEAG